MTIFFLHLLTKDYPHLIREMSVCQIFIFLEFSIPPHFIFINFSSSYIIILLIQPNSSTSIYDSKNRFIRHLINFRVFWFYTTMINTHGCCVAKCFISIIIFDFIKRKHSITHSIPGIKGPVKNRLSYK